MRDGLGAAVERRGVLQVVGRPGERRRVEVEHRLAQHLDAREAGRRRRHGRDRQRPRGIPAGIRDEGGTAHARPAVIVTAISSRGVPPWISIAASPAVSAADRAATWPEIASGSPS
jgi:hypothetical protein